MAEVEESVKQKRKLDEEADSRRMKHPRRDSLVEKDDKTANKYDEGQTGDGNTLHHETESEEVPKKKTVSVSNINFKEIKFFQALFPHV